MANIFWKLTRFGSRQTTEATVDSCEWVEYHEHWGGGAGHYQVKFSYQTDGRGPVLHGEFCKHGTQHLAPYRVGERLQIEYDPKKPTRSHFNGATPNYEKLEAIVVMTVFGLIAGYLLYSF